MPAPSLARGVSDIASLTRAVARVSVAAPRPAAVAVQGEFLFCERGVGVFLAFAGRAGAPRGRSIAGDAAQNSTKGCSRTMEAVWTPFVRRSARPRRGSSACLPQERACGG